MIESISQIAGKVLLEIYLKYREKYKVPTFDELITTTQLQKQELKIVLKYNYEKEFIDLKMYSSMGIILMDAPFIIKNITAKGIDIIEKPADELGKKEFNVIFNFNNEFNIESIIKGEMKLF